MADETSTDRDRVAVVVSDAEGPSGAGQFDVGWDRVGRPAALVATLQTVDDFTAKCKRAAAFRLVAEVPLTPGFELSVGHWRLPLLMTLWDGQIKLVAIAFGGALNQASSFVLGPYFFVSQEESAFCAAIKAIEGIVLRVSDQVIHSSLLLLIIYIYAAETRISTFIYVLNAEKGMCGV